MNGRENRDNPEVYGETPEERHAETLLRHAAVWKTENPEPHGLAYRALDKKGVLTRAPRILPIRHWWSLGTVGAGAALSLLLYAHPLSPLTPFTSVSDERATPEPQVSSRANIVKTSVAEGTGSTKSDSTAVSARNEGNNVVGIAPNKDSESQPALPLAHQESLTRKTGSLKRSAKNKRSANTQRSADNHRSFRRRIPETEYHPRQETYLASTQRHASSLPPARNASRSSGKITVPVEAPADSWTKIAGANHAEVKPVALDSESLALVPVVLTHESEDGTEIIATPALVEIAYNR